MFAANELDSDHVPVLLLLGTVARNAEVIKKDDPLDRFTVHLEVNMLKIPPIQSSQQLDDEVQTFTDARQSIDKKSQKKQWRENPLPAEIWTQITEENASTIRWQLTWVREMQRRYNRQAEEVKTAIRDDPNKK